ncbi:alpha/beta fold hydrolase [Roseiarcus fermentans]|uniref:alpha/beta fold hydrolase n=1 Tax=Roseiarcus fermentans TaxID=1473586 RepID=UPI0014731BE0|nr:alpha/beta hydrolase [Roseiarcus fermentans]
MAESSLEFSYADVNDVMIHCAAAGPRDGPLVVLLHGFPEFWFAWRDYFRPLAERGFRVVAPDQRGYNLSGKPEGAARYRLAAAAADVFALADALGRQRFHVVGHDWGAAVAWTMAGIDPKRLTSATMIQAPHPAVWLKAMREDPEQRARNRYVRILRMPWLSEMGLKLGNYAGLAHAFRESARPEAFPPEVLDLYREAWRRPGALTGMLNWYRALFEDDPALPPPRSLKPPTLVLWGDRDVYCDPQLADRSAALCANARIRHLPQATHWIIHDAPEIVRDALLDHL